MSGIKLSAHEFAVFSETPVASKPAFVRRVYRKLQNNGKKKRQGGGSYSRFLGIARSFLVSVPWGSGCDLKLEADNLQARGINDSARAIRKFLQMLPRLRLLGSDFVRRPEGCSIRVMIGELAVNAMPDIVIEEQEEMGITRFGALRFAVAEEESPIIDNPQIAKTLAVITYMWCRDRSTLRRLADPDLCVVVEPFQQEIIHAKDVEAKISALLEHARDFARIWHRIEREEAA